MRVGFVGIGSQGGPMAQRIIAAGDPTTVWARREAALEPFVATGAQPAASRAELGAASDLLCVCVVDDAGVDDVLRGADGAMAAMAPGSAVVVHSTVHPDTCVRLANDHPDLDVIDAPVSGGGAKAAERELLVMVGGDPAAVERCRPVFDTYGNPVVHVGPLGAGQKAKLLNNALFAAQLALAAEVYSRATARGLDPHAVAMALAAGSGRSYAAGLIAMMGFGLDNLAGDPAALLAKDVGILAALDPRDRSTLLDAANAAVELMGAAPTPGKESR